MDDARLAKKERNQAWLASVTLLVFIAAWPACDHADSIQGQETDAGDDLSAPEAGALSPPLVSGESTPIPDANAGIGPERQQYLAVAVGASQALLAWADNRSDPAGYGGSDILAVRYAVDGTLLDIAPIRIAATHDNETSPSVAFGGGMFFVTWDAMNRSPNGDQQRSWLRGTRLSVDGTVLDPDGLEIAADAYAASVAFVEDRFMVAYEGTLGARPLSVRSVSLSGTVDAVPVLIHESGTEPRMATDGQHALLFYRFEAPERSLRLQLLRADATTEKEITWPTTGWSAALTGSPSGFAALWTDDGHAMLRRLDTNGQWTDDAPIAHQCSGAVRDGEGTLLASPRLEYSQARGFDRCHRSCGGGPGRDQSG